MHQNKNKKSVDLSHEFIQLKDLPKCEHWLPPTTWITPIIKLTSSVISPLLLWTLTLHLSCYKLCHIVSLYSFSPEAYHRVFACMLLRRTQSSNSCTRSRPICSAWDNDRWCNRWGIWQDSKMAWSWFEEEWRACCRRACSRRWCRISKILCE